jgi:anti-anti-sigma factor
MSTPARQTAPHDLLIDTRLEKGAHRLLLRGELDLASAWNLEEVVARLCIEGAREIVLDIGELDFIDSTGLRAILTSRAVCAESNCALSLAPAPEQVPPQVRRLFQVTGLIERLPFAAPRKPDG